MPSRGFAATLLAALTLLPAVPLAGANHAQTDSGNVIVFDHKGGNEWWVEVLLSGQDAGSVARVEAMDDGGPWVAMAYHPEWAFGDWAASFHVEPGHRVMFRASWSGGAQQVSCWFTHPAGVEQCGTSPPEFQPTFTLVTGNEWWVQTQVTPNAGHATASVDVRLNNGAWQPLKLQSWGVREYAASYHIVDGTVVQLRATDTAGASGLSECFQWLPPQQNGETAHVVPCSPPPPPPTAFFVSNLKGNEWWIEAQAHSKSPLAGVDTRVNGGPWTAMTLRSWGSWAVSTHAPLGSHVQFRARFPDGTYAFLPNGYVWTSATQWPPPSSTFDARFENTDHGNWNWVQVNVYASASWGLGAVRARVDGGPWQDLSQKPWGDWAAPIKADNGSIVEFLAFSAGRDPGGALSGKYVWPSGRPMGAWPVEGSFVSYHLLHGFGSPGGGYAVETNADLKLVYHAGAWSGTCVGRTQESSSDSPSDPYVVYHDYNWSYAVHEGPPMAPTSPAVGSSYNFHPLEAGEIPSQDSGSCGHTERISLVMGKERTETALKDRDGHALTMSLWAAHHDPSDTTPVADDLWWDPHLGLLLVWDHSQQDAGGSRAWMTDTDAPIR